MLHLIQGCNLPPIQTIPNSPCNKLRRFSQLPISYIYDENIKNIFYFYILPLTTGWLNLHNLLQIDCCRLIHRLGPNNLSNFLFDSISLLMISSFSFSLYFFNASSVILLIFSSSFRSLSNLSCLSASLLFSFLAWKQSMCMFDQYKLFGTELHLFFL